MSRCYDCGAEMEKETNPAITTLGLKKKVCQTCGRQVYWDIKRGYVYAIFPGHVNRRGVISLGA